MHQPVIQLLVAAAGACMHAWRPDAAAEHCCVCLLLDISQLSSSRKLCCLSLPAANLCICGISMHLLDRFWLGVLLAFPK
jgi:hypothetical protein